MTATRPRLAASLGILLLLAAGPAPAQFQAGDILLNNFGGSPGNVQRYSAAGALQQTFTTGNVPQWKGATLTPGGNLVTTAELGSSDGVAYIFQPNGNLATSFSTSGLGNVMGGGFPSDVGVFGNGTIAIASQNFNKLVLYSAAGVELSQVGLPGVNNPFGMTVGADNVLYLTATNSNTLTRIDQSGTLLGTANLSFQPGDVVRKSDGTLYVSGASDGRVHHVTVAGADLDSFATGLSGPFYGLALSPDETKVYGTGFTSSVIRQFDLIGNQLGDLAISSPNSPLFLTVVPVPEPAGLLAVAAGLLAVRRWRRGHDRASDDGARIGMTHCGSAGHTSIT